LNLEDVAKPGEFIVLKAGDITHIDKGTKIECSTPTKCKGSFTMPSIIAQRLNVYGSGFWVALKEFGDLSFVKDAFN
jgi:ethanolamine utilization protein EutQ (cupin superfamily)